MPSGSHPPFPTQKPNLVASLQPARRNTRRIRHKTFVTRAAEGLQEPDAHCKRRGVAWNNPAYHRCATAKRLSTMPPSCLSPIRSGPFSEGSQSIRLSVRQTYAGTPGGAKGVRLHENWACGTMKPPIREPAAVSLQPGRSDMSNIQPWPFAI